MTRRWLAFVILTRRIGLTRLIGLTGLVGLAAACAGAPMAASPSNPGHVAHAPLSLAADERMVVIPAGRFVAGSTPEERATAYDNHVVAAGNDLARTEKWFDREAERHVVDVGAYRIDLMPVTQSQFAEFVLLERGAAPSIDQAAWPAQGIALDVATARARYAWRDSKPPVGREEHPVVLVTWDDADRYCRWRGTLRGERRRLPTADEFEKAARGDGGLAYPWGNGFEADKLNSAIGGPGDTTPVGNYATGASPYGLLDMAGNVLQWTATPADGEMVVKGSDWHAFAGLGRGASIDRRPRSGRFVVVGFRCAADALEP